MTGRRSAWRRWHSEKSGFAGVHGGKESSVGQCRVHNDAWHVGLVDVAENGDEYCWERAPILVWNCMDCVYVSFRCSWIEKRWRWLENRICGIKFWIARKRMTMASTWMVAMNCINQRESSRRTTYGKFERQFCKVEVRIWCLDIVFVTSYEFLRPQPWWCTSSKICWTVSTVRKGQSESIWEQLLWK